MLVLNDHGHSVQAVCGHLVPPRGCELKPLLLSYTKHESSDFNLKYYHTPNESYAKNSGMWSFRK